MRGTLRRFVKKVNPGWITPACAGNTSITRRIHRARWDHPRLCGEHGNAFSVSCNTLGSPPPVRGTLLHHGLTCQNPGITPACAGNTYTIPHFRCSIWDHPRLCGEHCTAKANICPQIGSPPPVRGTQK